MLLALSCHGCPERVDVSPQRTVRVCCITESDVFRHSQLQRMARYTWSLAKTFSVMCAFFADTLWVLNVTSYQWAAVWLNGGFIYPTYSGTGATPGQERALVWEVN